jgi:hypothetical protein
MNDDSTQTRRVHARYDGRLPARYALVLRERLGEDRICQTRNLSHGGCMLTTAQEVLALSHVVVHVHVPNGTWVRLRGVVRWSVPPVKSADGALREVGTFGVAFEDPMLPRHLTDYLEDCARGKRSK